jgi:membrane protease YdiL (CAAX protease family)
LKNLSKENEMTKAVDVRASRNVQSRSWRRHRRIIGIVVMAASLSAIALGIATPNGSLASRVLGAALLAVLALFDPARAWISAIRDDQASPPSILRYSALLAYEWLLAGWCGVVVLRSYPDFRAVGLQAISANDFFGWCIVLTILDLLAVAFLAVFSHWRLLPSPTPDTYAMTPRNKTQRIFAVLLLAPTAGFCEELLYRGYLLCDLTRLSHSLLLAVVISSVAFGLLHCDQGSARVIYISISGALLTFPVIALGSLYPSIALHAGHDALCLGWIEPRRYRLRWRRSA